MGDAIGGETLSETRVFIHREESDAAIRLRRHPPVSSVATAGGRMGDAIGEGTPASA
jgi:hypothetical protein